MVPFICYLNYSFPWARGYLWDKRRLLQAPRVPQVAKYRPTSCQVSLLPSTGPRHYALSQMRKSNQASHLPQPAILTLCTGAATWGKDHHVPHTKTAGCVPSTLALAILVPRPPPGAGKHGAGEQSQSRDWEGAGGLRAPGGFRWLGIPKG